MAKQYRTVEPGVWKQEKEGDQIEGILIIKDVATENVGSKYHIETLQGEKRFIWGSAILDQRMNHVNVGDQVRITYEGTTKNKKGQDTHMWKVEVAEDVPDVPTDVKKSEVEVEEGDKPQEPIPVENIE